MTRTQTLRWNKAKRKYLYAPKGLRTARYKALKDMTTKLLKEGA